MVAILALGSSTNVFSEVGSSPVDPMAFIQTHCIDCHGEEKQKGDRRFDQLTLDFHDFDTVWDWEEILDLLNLGEIGLSHGFIRGRYAEWRHGYSPGH